MRRPEVKPPIPSSKRRSKRPLRCTVPRSRRACTASCRPAGWHGFIFRTQPGRTVQSYIDRSLFVLLIPGTTAGLRWEIDRIVAGGHVAKLILALFADIRPLSATARSDTEFRGYAVGARGRRCGSQRSARRVFQTGRRPGDADELQPRRRRLPVGNPLRGPRHIPASTVDAGSMTPTGFDGLTAATLTDTRHVRTQLRGTAAA